MISNRIKPTYSSLQNAAIALATILMPGILLFVFTTVSLAETDKETATQHKVKPLTMFWLDDEGIPFRFPSTVSYDPTNRETYVLNNRLGRIVIYDEHYFPLTSLGAGRGVNAANGMLIDKDGQIYVCQRKDINQPARLTILNAAFFVVNNIFIQGFERADTFTPRRLAIGRDKTFYVAGETRGVLVLDREGNFLRWLKPQDRVGLDPDEVASADSNQSATAAEETASSSEEIVESLLADLPAGLLPSTSDGTATEEPTAKMGPVRVNDVTIDSQGRIYCLSRETSKVYVFDSEENFLFSFGMKGGSTGKMSQPHGMAIDEERDSIFIVDYMRHTILVYNLAGKFLYEFGGKGWSPGWYNYPTSITVTKEGHIIVADFFNNRVQVLDPTYKASPPSKTR